MRLCTPRQCYRRPSLAQCRTSLDRGNFAVLVAPTIFGRRIGSNSAQSLDDAVASCNSSSLRAVPRSWSAETPQSAAVAQIGVVVAVKLSGKSAAPRRSYGPQSNKMTQTSRKCQSSSMVAAKHGVTQLAASCLLTGSGCAHERHQEFEKRVTIAKAVRLWVEHGDNGSASPSILIAQLNRQGQLTPQAVSEALNCLLKHLRRNSVNKKAIMDGEVAREMLKIWAFTAASHNNPDIHQASADVPIDIVWPAISNGLFHRLLKSDQRPDGVSRIRSLWPNLSKEMAQALFCSVIDMFTHFAKPGIQSMQDHVHDFINFGSRLLYKARTYQRPTAQQNSAASGEPSIRRRMRLHNELHSHILIVLQLSRLGLSDAKVLSNRTVLSSALEEYFINDLGRMHERGTHARFRPTWAMARSTFRLLNQLYSSDEEGNRPGKPLPDTLTRMFLLTAFRSHNLDAAWRIWYYMGHIARQRTIKDWTAMMHGLGTERAIEEVERLWRSMADHAIEPDTAAWNVRIQANLLCGRFENAMQILSAMSEQCRAPTTGLPLSDRLAYGQEGKADASIDGLFGLSQTLQPSTRTLNTALTAMRRPSLPKIKLLLDWAAGVGITYDIYTYNSLLTIFAKLGDHKSFSETLTSMRKHQVKPDVVTFNLLVEYSVDTNTGYARHAIDIVVEHMQVMRAMELQPSFVLLARLLESLLFCGDLARAQELLEQSKEAGRSLHARLCATMVKGLFKHSYTDTSSIERMVSDIDDAQGGIGSDFYDATIQGLADRREVTRMHNHFSSAARLGIKLSWRTVYMCLKECISTADDSVVNEIIQYTSQAVASGGMSHLSEGRPNASSEYEHQFWLLVENHRKAS